MSIIEELKGMVALPDFMNCSLADFARRVAGAIEDEQGRAMPNNYLIAILCDAGRLAYECGQHPRIVKLRAENERLRKALRIIQHEPRHYLTNSTLNMIEIALEANQP